MKKGDPILVAGGAETMLGRAIVRKLREAGFESVLAPTRDELPLDDGRAVHAYFRQEQPRFVFHAAGRTGGIEANRRYPATLMLDNLAAETTVLAAARMDRVQKLVYLASSCCYPRAAPQPMHPGELGKGPFEPTNEAYAAAKLAGITLCQAVRQEDGLDYVAAIPANHFGREDDFSETDSHVVGALIRRFHDAVLAGAPSVTLWGTGTPRRELLHVDDIASAGIHVMKQYSDREPINLGGGAEVSIAELALEIAVMTGFKGAIEWDASRPDGMPRKLLDSTRLFGLGWRPTIPLREALLDTYDGFKNSIAAHA